MEQTKNRPRAGALTSIWQNPWFMVPTLLYLNAGLALAFFVPHGEEVLWFNQWRQEPLNTVFRMVTQLGEVYAYVAFVLFFTWWRYRLALIIAFAGLVTIPTVHVLKRQIGAPRPATFFVEQSRPGELVAVPEDDPITGHTSFPSGHTFAAFSLYSLATLSLQERFRRPRLGLWMAILAMLVGLSRIFLAQHFLSDILFGAILGLGMGSLWWYLGLKLKKYPKLERGLSKRG